MAGSVAFWLLSSDALRLRSSAAAALRRRALVAEVGGSEDVAFTADVAGAGEVDAAVEDDIDVDRRRCSRAPSPLPCALFGRAGLTGVEGVARFLVVVTGVVAVGCFGDD